MSSTAQPDLPRHPARAQRVLLVGWDSADWQIINPLLDAGKLPTLQSFLKEGAMGNIAALQPILSPILWTSIATGKRSFKHGIHGFTEPMTDGTGIQPVSSTSRQGKAIWNILSQMGLRTQVYGWFASHPAEPLPDGICVTDAFPHIGGTAEKPTALTPESVYPERLREVMEDLRVHPTKSKVRTFTRFSRVRSRSIKRSRCNKRACFFCRNYSRRFQAFMPPRPGVWSTNLGISPLSTTKGSISSATALCNSIRPGWRT